MSAVDEYFLWALPSKKAKGMPLAKSHWRHSTIYRYFVIINCRELIGDVTAHAEVLVIREAQ